MEHLAEVIVVGILILAILRLATGIVVGLLAARRPRPGRTRLGHVMAGIVGAVIIPVAVEAVIGTPVMLVSQLVKGWFYVLQLLAYIIAFSAAGAAVAVWIYRNVRLDPGSDASGESRQGR
jgi:hypothetical protein